ncbi:hypothetical protein AMTRI_Chr01g108600 [Amborella trichopoda]
MLRENMIPMMMGSTPIHTMQLTLLFLMMTSSSLYFFPFSFPPLMCTNGLWVWIISFLDNELITEFKNFECWIIFSYFYCVWSLWSMDYGIEYGLKCMDYGVTNYGWTICYVLLMYYMH